MWSKGYDMRTKSVRSGFLVGLASLVLASCQSIPTGDEGAIKNFADAIYSGGSVITMADGDTVAEALAIDDGRIVAVGTERDIIDNFRGPRTEMVDLDDGALLPGFIDAHGHFQQTGLLATIVNILPPPDRDVDSVADVVAALDAQKNDPIFREIGWLVGMGYDDAQLSDGRHPTKDDLAAIDTDLPILIIHQSSHLGVVDQKGLDRLAIADTVDDPPGGKFRRSDDGSLNGVLEETAFFAVASQALSKATPQMLLDRAAAAQKAYLAAGFTTAQEGRAQLAELTALRDAAQAGILDIDVVAYPDPTFAPDADAFIEIMNTNTASDYVQHARLGGIKLSLDGSPQGKTAWLSSPYFVAPDGQADDYAGYGQVPDEVLERWLGEAATHGWQVLTHVNGDAAIDQLLNAVEKTGANRLRRPVAIHAQTARMDQLDRMKQFGMIPSFMSVHTFYWGDWHRDSVLGPERASMISPAASALERGMLYTSHNDAPVTLPNSQMILYAQVNRLTRSGQVLGADERVSVLDALRAITINAAYQHFEEGEKGTLEVGKIADLVILDRNPLAIPTKQLLDLKVIATIKEGEELYRAR